MYYNGEEGRERMLMLANEAMAASRLFPLRKVVYLDIPVHDNIGDLLIMLGTIEFFRRGSFSVRRILSFRGYSPRMSIADDEVIALHGGGNFGDLYPNFQQFREDIVRRYPNNSIIILPQTLYFSSDASERASREIFSRHRNLCILARDRMSYDTATRFSSNVALVPDMAHLLYDSMTLQRSIVPEFSHLDVVRSDQEAKSHGGSLPNVGVPFDWPRFLRGHERMTVRGFQIAMRLLGMANAAQVLTPSWCVFARALTRNAAEHFARYQSISSSRLHGFLLAALLERRATLVDNVYGKNAWYFDTWYR